MEFQVLPHISCVSRVAAQAPSERPRGLCCFRCGGSQVRGLSVVLKLIFQGHDIRSSDRCFLTERSEV